MKLSLIALTVTALVVPVLGLAPDPLANENALLSLPTVTTASTSTTVSVGSTTTATTTIAERTTTTATTATTATTTTTTNPARSNFATPAPQTTTIAPSQSQLPALAVATTTLPVVQPTTTPGIIGPTYGSAAPVDVTSTPSAAVPIVDGKITCRLRPASALGQSTTVKTMSTLEADLERIGNLKSHSGRKVNATRLMEAFQQMLIAALADKE